MKIKQSNINVSFLILILSLVLININYPSVTHQNEIENPLLSAGEITIITPENITYTDPMSGYYPATYGFEEDKLNSLNEDIRFVSKGSVDPNTEVSIVSEIDSHKNVLKVSDNSNTGNVEISNRFSQNQTYGIIEFWVRTTEHRRSYFKITEAVEFTDNQVDLN